MKWVSMSVKDASKIFFFFFSNKQMIHMVDIIQSMLRAQEVKNKQLIIIAGEKCTVNARLHFSVCNSDEEWLDFIIITHKTTVCSWNVPKNIENVQQVESSERIRLKSCEQTGAESAVEYGEQMRTQRLKRAAVGRRNV